MKIKKLELNNFRQFKGKNEIKFSMDDDKNITFIMAENGSGKTTIIEAFRFLFLGKTKLKPDELINLDLSKDLSVGDNYEIKVIVELEYNKQIYEITRKQNVSKGTNRVTLCASTVHINYKDKNGQTITKNELDAIMFIRKIMPEDLFDYFFFKGEEIGILGQSLFENNSRQNEFAKAIKNLIGFTYLYNMQDDLGKVQKKFDTELSEALAKDDSNKKIQDDIISKRNELEKIENEKARVNDEIKSLDEELDKINIKLLDNKDTTEMQKRRQELKKQLENKQVDINAIKQEMFKIFSESGWYLFATKLFDKGLKTLDAEESMDKGIPGINIDCIDYILEQKQCICGNEIIEGSKAYLRLQDLKKYLPPENIGMLINEFKDKVEDINKRYNLTFENIKNRKEVYYAYNSEYISIEKAIDGLDEKLSGTENMENYVELQKKMERDKNEKFKEIGALDEQIRALNETISNKEKSVIIENNNIEAKQIKKCILYTKCVAEKLVEYLEIKQSKMKEELEKTINDIYNSVFQCTNSLKLNDDYSLSVIDESSNNITKAIGQGGAESTIIAFAFIGAVIGLSKKHINQKNNGDNIEEEIEPYPLVLDAPSSSMDKRVINEFFAKMPTFAEQTLILTKDTDGEYVENILSSKIGKRYTFERKGIYETKIVGG